MNHQYEYHDERFKRNQKGMTAVAFVTTPPPTNFRVKYKRPLGVAKEKQRHRLSLHLHLRQLPKHCHHLLLKPSTTLQHGVHRRLLLRSAQLRSSPIKPTLQYPMRMMSWKPLCVKRIFRFLHLLLWNQSSTFDTNSLYWMTHTRLSYELWSQS